MGDKKQASRYQRKSRSSAQKAAQAHATACSLEKATRSGKLFLSSQQQLTVHLIHFSNRDSETDPCNTSLPPHPSSTLSSTSCPHISPHTKKLQQQLASLGRCYRETKIQSAHFRARGDIFRKKLHSATRHAHRLKQSQEKVQSELKTAKTELQAARELVIINITAHERALADAAACKAVHAAHLRRVTVKLRRARRDVRKYQRQGVSLQARIEKLLGSTRKHSLIRKGVYTGPARRLMRELACLGVPAEKISTIMHLCAHSYGIILEGNPSA